MEQTIGVSIILLDETKTMLLLGKRINCYKAGHFGLPTGRVEQNEPIEIAAKRELLEETSLNALSLTYLGVAREFQGDHNFVHFAYICQEFHGTVTNQETEKCESWNWYTFDQLPDPILPGHQAAITMFLKNIPFIDLITT